MKSVILCAGEGTRASGHTSGTNKCLTEIPNHGVLIDYSLKSAIDLTGGAIVLVGHRADDVREYIDGYIMKNFPQAHLEYAEQRERRGICDGLLCLEPLLEGDDFLMFLGDEIITNPAHKKMTELFSHSGALAVCGYIYAKNIEDVRKTYSLELYDGKVMNINEKPSSPINNLMGTGNCVFRNTFLGHIRRYCEKMSLDKPLFSFPDVLKDAVDSGEIVIACEIGKAYLNFNHSDDIAYFLHEE